MITPRSPNDNVQNMCSNSSTFWDALSSDKPTYLVGGDWNMAFMTFHILGIIMPTDVHIYQRGWNHQPVLLVHVHVFECYRIYFCLWQCTKAGLHRRESQWWNWYDVVLRCCGWSLENYTQTDFFQNWTCYMAIWSLFNGWYIMLNIMPYSEYSCQASLSNCWYIIFYDVIWL